MTSFQDLSIHEMQQVEGGGMDWGAYLESLMHTVFIA